MHDVVETARAWVGTPFHWGGSVRGTGCDCKGLIAGVARDLGRIEANSFEALFIGYGNRSNPDMLQTGMARLFDPVSEKRPGDLMLLNINGKPLHLAIYIGDGRMIHTYSKSARPEVKNVPMGTYWSEKVHSIWRWRDDG